GGGIAGAAYAGQYAGEKAIEALEAENVSESMLWEYNERVMEHFGGRYAALDVYNIFSTAYDLDELLALLAALPAEKLSDALYSGSADVGLGLKLRVLYRTFGHWDTLRDLYEAKSLADRLLDHYETYPSTPAGFDEWREERDAIMDDIYEATGAEAKY
ncbi:MAG: electron transfer flavoprotein, partial [Natronomonas sp.]